MKIRTALIICWLALPVAAWAQGAAVVSTQPARHALSAPAAGPVTVTFAQPVGAAGAVRVFGNQRRGLRPGTVTAAGSNVSFQPAQPFAPGEQVQVTVPAAVASPAHVYEFTAAAAQATATFGAATYIALPTGVTWPSTITAGDLDNDGDLDLVLTRMTTSGANIYLNNGQGGFTLQPTVLLSTQPLKKILLLDFNNDGNLDMLGNSFNQVSVWLGNGTGAFNSGFSIAPSGSGTTPQVTVADFNADGFMDIATSFSPSPVGPVSTTSVWLNNQTGGVAPAIARTALPYQNALTCADMDEDGDMDLVIGSIDFTTKLQQVHVWLNDGTGNFTAGITAPLPVQTSSLITGDFTGDGHIDVAAAGNAYVSTVVTLLPGNGAGGFQPQLNVMSPTPLEHLSAGDLDGDGDLDMLVTSGRGFTQIRLNDGTGTFATGATLIATEWFTSTIVADFNNDGALDVAAVNARGHLSSSLCVFFNQITPLGTCPTNFKQLRMTVYPNPAHEQLTLQLAPQAGMVSVEMLNALGQRVLALEPARPAADGTLPVSLAGLAPGVYLVRVTTSSGNTTQRVVVQ